MLRRLVEFSLEFRGVTVTLACLLFSYGVFAAFQAKLDVFPEFAPPQVVVMTEAPGLSPEEVEALVTTPVERAMIGVGDLQTIRSQSIQGFSVITASFLPWEILEIIHRHTFPRIGLLVVNVAVLIYLSKLVWERKRGSKRAAPATGG